MILKKIFAALLAVSLLWAGVFAEEMPVPESDPAEILPEEADVSEDGEESQDPEDPQDTENPEGPEEHSQEEEGPPAEETTEEETASAAATPEEAEAIQTSASDETESAEIIDLHETTAHAAARLHEEEKMGQSFSEGVSSEEIQTDSGLLVSKGKIASFDSVINEGSVEFIKLYFINDRPVYCVEPDVNLRLINGEGGVYTGRTWDSLDGETRTLLKRIAYFGYGFPAVGSDNTAYAATQALVWSVVSTKEQWEKIHGSLHMCGGVQSSFTACTADRAELDARMEKIMHYVRNYDTVPSFAAGDHTVKTAVMKWNETLDLEDANHVLSWFEEDSEESHRGIDVKIQGNHLLVKIRDLCYEGHETENGKVLTFRRKKEDWENMMNGLLLYEQGEQQKLMAAGGEDPVPLYRMAFHLETGGLELTKTDEYGAVIDGEETAFMLGWKRDPKGDGTGGNANEGLGPDGNLLWPVMTEDGSSARLFRTDAGGRVRIEGILPAEEEFWLKEAECGSAYELSTEPWSVRTGKGGKTESYRFANRLKSVCLEVRKRDAEEKEKLLSEAGFLIYETGEAADFSRAPAPSGIYREIAESAPSLTWKQLKENSSLKPGEKFVYGGYEYKITEVKEDRCAVEAEKIPAAKGKAMSRYRLPANPAKGKTFDVRTAVNMHASFSPDDDELTHRQMKIEDILREEDGAVVLVSCGEEEALTAVDLRDETPVYDDLPDARNLAAGDTFTLAYPWMEEDGTIEERTCRFTVLANGPRLLKIGSDTAEYQIEAPVWISFEEIPDRGVSNKVFRAVSADGVSAVTEDDRGNRYCLRREGTEIMENPDGNAHVSDISLGDFSLANGGDLSCGSSLTKELPVTEEIPYDGPQYADLSREERSLPEGAYLTRGLQSYEVRENDGISLTLSVVREGKEYLVQLTPSAADKAYFTRRIPVTFTVTEITGEDPVLFPEGNARVLSSEEISAEKGSGETIMKEEEHALAAGDRFEKDGIVYYVEQLEETRAVLFYPWQKEAPLSAEAILAGNLESGGIRYSKRSERLGSAMLYYLTSEADGKTFVYVSETVEKEPQETAPGEKITFEVRKPSEILFEELQSARYGEKREHQHITADASVYEILESNRTEEGVIYRISDENGEVYTIPDAEGHELPITLETIRNTPADLRADDVLLIRAEPMRIVYAAAEPGYGMTVRLRREKDGKIFEIRENPNPGNFETETLLFFEPRKTGVIPAEDNPCTYRLRSENPHIELGRTGSNWTVYADANTTAILECMDAESGAVTVKRLIFTSEREEGTMEALPVFAGKTGHQYLRITDGARHGRPAVGVKVTLYATRERNQEVMSAVTDNYGAVDLSGLAPGTYWYRDPITLEEKTAAVLSARNADGVLSVRGLRQNRTYLVLEESLPEGYDYQESEAVHELTPNAEAPAETVRLTVENRLRRMMIQVLKQDQDDQQTPLDNAWFTADDVTDLKESSEPAALPEVTLADIPPGAVSGDVFYVWPERDDEARRFFRIEEVGENEIILSLLENGKFEKTFRVPKSGYDSNSVMLYTDLLRIAGVPKKGAVFEAGWKEDPSAIRCYRILSLECEPARDVFGEVTGEIAVRKAVVEDTADSSHTEIVLADKDEAEPSETRIGEFISGGVIVRKAETVRKAPLTIEELRKLNMDAPGDVIFTELKHWAKMPGYREVLEKWNQGGTSVSSAGLVFEIAKAADGSFEIRAKGQSFRLYEQTIPGDVCWKEDGALRLESIEKENGRIVSALVRDEAGNSWLLREDDSSVAVTAGRAGVEVTVRSRSTGQVHHGYTGRDGRVIFAELPDGGYDIESEGMSEFAYVERGKIFLPQIPYGHLIRICETKSPLGYLKGNACAVIQPMSEAGIDTVTNTRANRKIVTRQEEIRKIVKVRKMGEEL